MKTKPLWLVLLICLAFAGQSHARYYDDVIASGYIRIGVYRDFPPYSFIRDGKPQGIDIDIGQRIADKLGVQMQIHWITPDEGLDDDLRNNVWKGHYLDKQTDQPLAMKRLADVMMRVPYDREYAYRRESTGELANEMVVMFGPYQRESWQVAFNPQKLESVETMAVFQYHPIGVEVDSLPAFYITSAFNGRMRKNAVHFASLNQAFAAMSQDKVDAVMGTRGEVDWLVAQAASADLALGENGFPMMGKQKWDLGMAIKHSYRQLGYAVEEVVDQMVRNGDMARLFRQYGLRYEKPALYQVVE